MSPIVFIVFNRPRHTERTFRAIRQRRPSQLFIVADGPRVGHPTDAFRCAEVRAIVQNIDWPCEVHRDYADYNLGLKRRVSSGLDWVFGQVESAIVLEDDCLPHPDFFTFCDAMLQRYAADKRVWVVTGNNFQDGKRRGEASYYFSRYNHCWGWASWQRAWRHYQGDLPFWTEWRRSADWRRKIPDVVERRYWSRIFDRVCAGVVDSWAYPWTASVWYYGGLTATPNVNLVTNIGFDPEGTNFKQRDATAELAAQPLGILSHPSLVAHDACADRYVFDHHFGGRDLRWFRRLIALQHRILEKLFS